MPRSESQGRLPRLINADSVKDIFGKPPGWMLYWGNTVVVLVLILLLLLAAIIRYPDEVSTRVQLTTAEPPVYGVAAIDETIASLLVEEGQEVQAGDPLLSLRSTARIEDMEQLDSILTQLEALSSPTAATSIQLPENLSLGDWRADYATLLNYQTELRYWLNRSNNGRQLRRIEQQLSQMEATRETLIQQQETLAEEVSLAENNYRQYQQLLEREAASPLEVDEAQSAYLRSRRLLEQQDQFLLRNQMDSEQLELEKLRLTEGLSDQVTEQWLGLRRQVRSLRQGLSNWQETYLLRAETSGQVTFPFPLAAGQFVEAGTPLVGIVRESASNEVIAEGQLAAAAMGKITVGSEAYIQLSAYPYREFGQLEAQVSHIARAPSPGLTSTPGESTTLYRIQLELPQGLETTYGRALPFRQQMDGQVFILSEDRSFLGRLLDRFRDLRGRRF